MARTKATIRRGIAERNALAEKNLGLAHTAARRFCSTTSDRFDDVHQESRIGLLHAAETFDETRPSGARDPFAGYVAHCARQQIVDAMRDTGNLIRVPRYAHTLLADAITVFKGRKLESRKKAHLALAPQTDPANITESDAPEFGSRWLFVDLHEAMGNLLLRERWLVHAYYWKKLRLTDIGARLGVTRWIVTRMLETVVGKLRQTLEAA